MYGGRCHEEGPQHEEGEEGGMSCLCHIHITTPGVLRENQGTLHYDLVFNGLSFRGNLYSHVHFRLIGFVSQIVGYGDATVVHYPTCTVLFLP